ncbi:hypothetical protein B0O40_1738 [Ruminococcaceae bacterium R-25]|nr:hypothetical protein B0O40_1738 [Ruminococcaceae bacterium R-25]SUQ21602.1 hypothetical protein SAMN06297423_1738 [Oscillospiraceae bacterium]
MNLLKKTAAGILVLVFALAGTACSKRLSLDNVTKVAEECGLEQTEDLSRILNDVSGTQDYNEQVFCYAEKTELAQQIYDVVYNRSNTYPKHEIQSAAVMYTNAINGEGKAVRENAYLFTFKSGKKASEFYQMLVDEFGVLEHAEGKDKYQYTLYLSVGEKNVVQQGIYLEGKTVVIVSGIGYGMNDFMLVDRCCKEMDLIAPESLK